EGIRTLATAVRGRRPGPLDDGAVCAGHFAMPLIARVPGGQPPERRDPPGGRPGVLVLRSPEGIRTLATAVRGRRPGPLDDGAVRWCGSEELSFLAGVPGLEPRLTEPETVGLPITPYPMGGASRRRRRRYLTAATGVAPTPGPAGQRAGTGAGIGSRRSTAELRVSGRSRARERATSATNATNATRVSRRSNTGTPASASVE